MPEDEIRFPITRWARRTLIEGIEFIQLNSKTMKNPCRPDLPIEFQPDGSNLPLVVHYLKKEHPDNYQNWLEHVQTAIPEIKEINIIERPEDRYLYLTVANHNDLKLPSWVLSDGTLRLLALTIIAYLPVEHKVYLIEEPENGLHPLAIETVYQSLSSVYNNQVLMATHSPAILRLAEPLNILCFAKTESGAAVVIRGDEHPRLKDWRKGVDIATLHAAGVLQ
ncbi:MAG: ATP-binding protein [Candidatus Neomarinimicrobiota bacterium]